MCIWTHELACIWTHELACIWTKQLLLLLNPRQEKLQGLGQPPEPAQLKVPGLLSGSEHPELCAKQGAKIASLVHTVNFKAFRRNSDSQAPFVGICNAFFAAGTKQHFVEISKVSALKKVGSSAFPAFEIDLLACMLWKKTKAEVLRGYIDPFFTANMYVLCNLLEASMPGVFTTLAKVGML
ncbi:hypothetical protein DI09_41p80 [Mitosporidium daphniae]|uniref:Uncharacterized protein n=1 Tax=Mitosporidium daphniae TaxID=1485682 RepID=A0A098VU03_9MICR|nr:uncharacterized protein DI09_41p80 [Mitosporidium daphniae]KGG51196.1 hypothetical protein DI09_41p80 [Mitosporidium daphniae]|eukprot:XP_013237645.1 uncharacterized protein DI09_41p80 [Mitosporidium daphniae]